MRPPTTRVVTGEQLREWTRPCVYAWRRDGKWLYVGQSARGLARLWSHHVLKYDAILPTDEILLWHVDHYERMRLEAELIFVNRPLYNRAIPRDDCRWWEWERLPERPKKAKPARKPRPGRPTAAEMREYREKSARPRIGSAMPILRTREAGSARTHARTADDYADIPYAVASTPALRHYFRAAQQFKP